MWMTGIVLLLVTCCNSEDLSCYADDANPYLQFATRTDTGRSSWTRSLKLPGCEASRLWMLVRPGVSWPGRFMANRMKNLHSLRDTIVANHQQGRGNLCGKDVENLETSSFPSKIEEDKMENQGIIDLHYLGETIKKAFKNLFDNPYTNTDYEIRHTKYENARQSAAALARGLFGEEFDVKDLPEPLQHDHLLDFIHQCEAWKLKVVGACAKERGAFDRSPSMQALRVSISRRLGFKRTLSLTDILTMYVGCSLQNAMNPTALPAWCAVFNASESKLLEYREDLMYYRACGPGDDTLIVRRLSCSLVNDLLHKFQSREDKPRATIYVADERALLILLYGLGVADTDLGTVEDLDQRGYRTATLAPFAAHFLAVLYKCSQGDRHRVGFYLNGHPVEDEPLPWGLVQQRLSSFYESSTECRVDVCLVDARARTRYGPGAVAGSTAAITLMATTLAAIAPVL